MRRTVLQPGLPGANEAPEGRKDRIRSRDLCNAQRQALKIAAVALFSQLEHAVSLAWHVVQRHRACKGKVLHIERQAVELTIYSCNQFACHVSYKVHPSSLQQYQLQLITSSDVAIDR